MLHYVLQHLSGLDVTTIYLVLFFFAFIENVFPPSPSDVVVVVGASLIATTSVDFIPILFITSVGSALGFLLMYYVGAHFGEKVVRTGKLKFISEEALQNADRWFGKYGYLLILVNRFLPGTRSVISFFSGVHNLKILKTFVLALVSATLWNVLIIFLGMKLGENADIIDYYLRTYSNIVITITVWIGVIILIRFYIRRRKRGKGSEN